MIENKPGQQMNADLRIWKRWRNSTAYIGLGFPKQSAEQVMPESSDKVLPAWETELRIDNIVEHEMPKEYRRIIFAAFNIRLRLKSLEENDIWISGMLYSEKDSLYHFPGDIESTARRSLGIAKPTYYNILKCAKAWLLGKEYSKS